MGLEGFGPLRIRKVEGIRKSKAPKTPFLAGFQLTFEILNEIFGYLSLESQAAVQKPKRDFC
jgi:hypothetical protein